MSEQSRLPDPHQLLASVRALLATVQQPLGALDGALTAPEQLLAEMTPALAVVDFSPFAQLMVNETDTRQPAPKPALHSTGIPPAVTTAATAASQALRSALPSSTRPGAAPQATLTRDPVKPPPVFSLPSQKQGTNVGALSSTSRDALPNHSVTQLAASPTAHLAGSEVVYADHSTSLASFGDDEPARVPVTAPMLTEQRTQQGSSLPGIDPAAAPPLATMSLLATVVDRLLATTPAGNHDAIPTQGASAPGVVAAPASPATPTSSDMQWPTDMTAARHSALLTNATAASPFQQPPVAMPSTNTPTADLATLLAGWPNRDDGHQSPNHPITQSPMDAWTLAQLINDVLAEEARRHGVDLS